MFAEAEIFHMTNKRAVSKVASAAALMLACGLAQAQTTINFEPPTYAPGVAAGQDGWYVPAPAVTPGSVSVSGNIYTFASNPFGITGPASGGLQFLAGECAGVNASGTEFVRSQHAVNFTGGSGVFQVSIDCLGTWDATSTNTTALDNLGSFSYQDSALTRYYQTLLNWGSTGNVATYPGGPTLTNYAATKDKFHVAMGYFTNTSPTAILFATPTAAWADRPINHWYRTTIKWDFVSSGILEVRIQDMTLNTPVDVADVSSRGWFLRGGLNSTYPTPTDARLFTGSAATGNVAAWDNYSYGTATVGSGACCIATGGCSIQTQTACVGSGGFYNGDNVTCAAANCPNAGACCLATGTCITVTSTSCTSQGGIFRGDGSVCSANYCSPWLWNADTVADVGDLPGTSSEVTGRGTAIKNISGNIDLDDADMYKIRVCDKNVFQVTAVGGSSLDTMVWLFDLTGKGIVMNDDSSATNGQSTIGGATGSPLVTANGLYYLAISEFQHTPFDVSSQQLWLFPQASAIVQAAPDGPGAANPLTGWTGATSTLGAYVLTCTGVCSTGCYANCDGSTSIPLLTANDFQCFLNEFAAGNMYANCDGSTAAPTLTANDFQCFLNAYAAGCN